MESELALDSMESELALDSMDLELAMALVEARRVDIRNASETHNA